MTRAALYIDGFNLYHALDNLEQPHLKWLNLWALGRRMLLDPAEELYLVRYCTAIKKGDPCIILLLAIDLATQGLLIAVEAFVTDLKEKVWVDTLTNRLFYRNFIDEIRLGNRPDVDHMFNLATKDAVADVLKARSDAGQNLEMGWFGKFGWGTWSFISNAFSYALGYGIPMVLASQ